MTPSSTPWPSCKTRLGNCHADSGRAADLLSHIKDDYFRVELRQAFEVSLEADMRRGHTEAEAEQHALGHLRKMAAFMCPRVELPQHFGQAGGEVTASSWC